jgi:hypothetical protein
VTPDRAERLRRRNRAWLAVAGLCVAAAVTAAIGERAHGAGSMLAPRPRGALTDMLTGPAPWPANVTGLRSRLAAFGLPALAREGTVLHIHEHLDVYVDGRRVTVPAGIGIDAADGFISPLHTHDESGVMHVESPTVRRFTLGEFFGVWGVRLDASHLGGYTVGGGKELHAYVNGERVDGDPGKIVLASHQEIVLAFGTAKQLRRELPKSYAFRAGL